MYLFVCVCKWRYSNSRIDDTFPLPMESQACEHPNTSTQTNAGGICNRMPFSLNLFVACAATAKAKLELELPKPAATATSKWASEICWRTQFYSNSLHLTVDDAARYTKIYMHTIYNEPAFLANDNDIEIFPTTWTEPSIGEWEYRTGSLLHRMRCEYLWYVQYGICVAIDGWSCYAVKIFRCSTHANSCW